MSVRVTVKIAAEILKQLPPGALKTLTETWSEYIREAMQSPVGIQVTSFESGLNTPELTLEVEYDVMDAMINPFPFELFTLEGKLLKSLIESSVLPSDIGVATLFKPVSRGRHTIRRRA